MDATAGRAQRSEDRSDIGVFTTIARRPGGVTSRESDEFITRPRQGQGEVGGDEGTRTPDPLLAKEVLSQLSYIPVRSVILAPVVIARLARSNWSIQRGRSRP